VQPSRCAARNTRGRGQSVSRSDQRLCRWLEHPRIGTGGPQFAFARVSAMRHAGNAPENCAEGAAQNIGRISTGKVDRLLCYERESQRVQPEMQHIVRPIGANMVWLLMPTRGQSSSVPEQSDSNTKLAGIEHRCAPSEHTRSGFGWSARVTSRSR